MKNAASYGVAKSIDVFAWPNRIMIDAIREEKHTKQLSHLFGCTTEGIGWLLQILCSMHKMWLDDVCAGTARDRTISPDEHAGKN